METSSGFHKGQERALNHALFSKGYFQHGECDIQELHQNLDMPVNDEDFTSTVKV